MTIAPAPMRILRLDHVVLRVHDLARAEAFYRSLLGAAVERRIDKPIVLVQLRIGEALLDLVPGRMPASGDDGASDNMEHFCLRVDPFDPDAITAHILACGGLPEPKRELYLPARPGRQQGRTEGAADAAARRPSALEWPRAAGTLCILITGDAPWNIESIARHEGFPVVRKPGAPEDPVQALALLQAVRHGPAHE